MSCLFKKSWFLALLLAVLVLTSIGEVSFAKPKDNGKVKIVRQVARDWIEAGKKEYQRGLYEQSERSFLFAQDYQQYLTEPERKDLSALLEKAHRAAIERRRISSSILAINRFLSAGQLSKAKTEIKQIEGNEYLTEQEREIITKNLLEINKQLAKQRAAVEDKRIEKLPPPSRRTEPAAGAIEDELLGREEWAEKPVVLAQAEPTVAETDSRGEQGYIAVVNRRRNILRSHIRAIVNDTVAKAESYISEGEFNKAEVAAASAEREVIDNQLYLGEQLYKQYTNQLSRLNERMSQAKRAKTEQLAQERRLAAINAQQEYEERLAVERAARIAELMENTAELQAQQRYEQALGQLESLLAIEPQHNEALILKDTLEDTISFRRQLEIQKEIGRERVKLLLETDQSTIPYANEITYPKNWREISAKRVAEEATGLDIADEAIYAQLDTVVDLSGLSPEMSFSNALEELKNSVAPKLKILVNWGDLLENAEIEQTTPANMDAITDIPLVTALEFLLESVSGGFVEAELGYVVEKGVIKISTKESLRESLENRVYDVTVLLGRPADFFARRGGGTGGTGGGSGSSRGGSSRGGGGEDEFGEFFDEDEESPSREELRARAIERAENLIALMEETIEPDSWFDAGGEGTIKLYEGKKLIVYQTRRVHTQITKLLKDLRGRLGHQVAIEARFLLVGENFLEDIGIDLDFILNPNLDWGGKFGPISFTQGSSGAVKPVDTGIPGSLAGLVALAISGSYGTAADDLMASFLIRAAQAHKDARTLTAPKVTVLSGESAVFRTQRTIRFALPPDIGSTATTAGVGGITTSQDIQQNFNEIRTGIILNVTPTISPDKRYVLLNIETEKTGLIEFTSDVIEIPDLAGSGTFEQEVKLPQTEIARVQTRVSVPDGGTLLLGGQKIMADVKTESGSPILSKIPIIGRLFGSRSKIRDHQILLILVKPTILLQEEMDAEAMAALDSPI